MKALTEHPAGTGGIVTVLFCSLALLLGSSGTNVLKFRHRYWAWTERTEAEFFRRCKVL